MSRAKPGERGLVWLVTGASSGLGLELARAAAMAGDTVVGTYRGVRPGNDVGVRRWVHLEVTDQSEREAVMGGVLREYGRIDVLVNNAGRASFGVVEETPLTEWRDLLELHLVAAIALVRLALPHMRERRSGHIVMVSSMRALLGAAGTGPYAASKAAVEAMAEALADEVADFGISVMVVEPGPLRTRFASPGRLRVPIGIGPYGRLLDAIRKRLATLDGFQAGDPSLAAALVVEQVASGRPPFRLPLGAAATELMGLKVAALEETLGAWSGLAATVDREPKCRSLAREDAEP